MNDEIKAAEEELQASEAIQAEDNSLQDSQTEEQTPGEVEEQINSNTETGESKKGAEARIKQLNNKVKIAEENNRSLRDKIAELTNPVGLSGQQPQYQPQSQLPVNEDGSVDAETFRQKILQETESRFELKLRQSEAVNRINTEADQVVREYPELDPLSDQYNKELSDSITEATEAYIKSNPYSASVKQFVAKLIKPYHLAIEKEVGQASENIAKQVSQTALRPTSVRKQEKTAGDKSIAELEQELGIVQS